MTDLQIDYGQLRSDKLLTDVTQNQCRCPYTWNVIEQSTPPLPPKRRRTSNPLPARMTASAVGQARLRRGNRPDL
jgi:hypothetical protein